MGATTTSPVLRHLLRLAYLLAVAGSAFLVFAETTVYVTKTGEKYHTGSCSYLRNSKIAKSLNEAVQSGYTPCSRCRPPAADGQSKSGGKPEQEAKASEARRSAPTSSQCAATTKKGTRCKRKAAAGSSYCWQHGK